MTSSALHSRLLVLAALAMTLSACTPVVETSNGLAAQSKQAIYDTKSKWADLLTYHPKPTTPQLPQTRYCYQMQSDIVCYDSVQPSMTASLVGYQDGPNIAWYQPGGGSTGYSGGPATSVYPQGNIRPITGSEADHASDTYSAATVQGVDEITATTNMPTTFRKAAK